MKEIVLPKIIAVGIYNAHVVFKNKAVSPNIKTTLFEIELPIGDGGTTYIDASSRPVSEKTVICAKPGQMRHTKLPYKCYYIHIIVSEGQLFDILSSLPNFIEFTSTDEIREIFTSLCSLYDTKAPEDYVMLQSLILRLIHLLNKSTMSLKTVHNPKRSNHEIIGKTVEYISANLTADLSLDTISKSVGFTPVYFHKLFRASTGKTLRDYVETERIKKAIELLLSTELTLTEIAYTCGFSSQSYFSYAFKKKMNCTPREYAKAVHLKYETAPHTM